MKIFLKSFFFALTCFATEALAEPRSKMETLAMPVKLQAHQYGEEAGAPGVAKLTAENVKKLVRQKGELECNEESGLIAGEFPCKNMNLVSFVTGEDLGTRFEGTWVSDIWGWVDPQNGAEYALVGMWDGTSILDITNPRNPKTIGFILTTDGVLEEGPRAGNQWRDIKVVNNVAYIGSEVDVHGLQAFDLTRLRTLPRGNKDIPLLEPDFINRDIGSSHNLVAFESAEKVMAVGLSADDKSCPAKGDLFASFAIFDVSGEKALAPVLEKCHYVEEGGTFVFGRVSGYVHDAHCIKYDGPDEDYKGVNICAAFMESEIVLINFDTFEQINVFSYDSSVYVHQGWFSEDHTTLYADDELDELFRNSDTNGFSRCYSFDLTDLDAPIAQPEIFVTPSQHPSIDHNLYTKDGHIYQASYTSGARIRKINEDMSLEEVAYFDGELQCECVQDFTDAQDDCACNYFSGTWTFYPYFDSGITIAGGIFEGLFILRPTL